MSSWRWAWYFSKHVKDYNVTYILLMNKELCIKVGNWNKSILWCTVTKPSKYILCCCTVFSSFREAEFLQHTKHTFDIAINIMFFDPQNVTNEYLLHIKTISYPIKVLVIFLGFALWLHRLILWRNKFSGLNERNNRSNLL